MLSLPSPMPPNSSGSVSPNTPSSATFCTTSSGMYAFCRCHSWACGMTSSSEKVCIWSRMAACVSSRPGSPKLTRLGLRGDEVGEALLDGLRAAGGDQVGDLVLVAAHVGARHAEMLGTHKLELPHGNAAGDLREVFGEGGDENQLLELAEAAFAGKTRAPHMHLPQALDRGRQPGEAVRLMLRVVDAAGR